MNLKEVNELIISLKKKPISNRELINFYVKKRAELIQRINAVINEELKANHLFN
jgi:hypothetical protein